MFRFSLSIDYPFSFTLSPRTPTLFALSKCLVESPLDMVTGLRAKENKALAAFPTFAMNHDYGCDETRVKNPHHPYALLYSLTSFFFVWLRVSNFNSAFLTIFCLSTRLQLCLLHHSERRVRTIIISGRVQVYGAYA